MNANYTQIVVVSYNSFQLIEKLITSIRRFYPSNEVHIIEGSDDSVTAMQIKNSAEIWGHVKVHEFGYNIHHGPGMAWAIDNISLSGPVLFLDSDIEVISGGFIENLLVELKPNFYGVGFVGFVNELGFDISYSYGAIAYLHPPCMLCNIEIMRQWPRPIKHGAPMFSTMKALHEAGKSDLVKNIPWVFNDTEGENKRIFLDHAGRGTVKATGSYNLDEWLSEVQSQIKTQTISSSHVATYNKDLFNLIPPDSNSIIEFGCSSGELAAAYKKVNPLSNYIGVELDKSAIPLAMRHCDLIEEIDIDNIPDFKLKEWSDRDCWIFGDVLEHLKDPAKLISRIRGYIKPNASIIICIPNMQHWSIFKHLCTGDLFYTSTGLLDKTHLRWFTRKTILTLFQQAGFTMEIGFPRIINDPTSQVYLDLIGQLAEVAGGDKELAKNDALPIQYVIRFKSIE